MMDAIEIVYINRDLVALQELQMLLQLVKKYVGMEGDIIKRAMTETLQMEMDAQVLALLLVDGSVSEEERWIEIFVLKFVEQLLLQDAEISVITDATMETTTMEMDVPQLAL